MKNNTESGSRALRTYWIVAGVLMAAIAAVLASLLHWGQAIEAADANYATGAAAADAACATDTRPGSAGRHRLRSRDGVPYVVVTPRNYRPQHGHPLLVVYAPAGFSAGLSERFAGLTHEATTAGYVLAFVASGPLLTPEAVRRMASVPADVAAQWCIAPGRIYATGHSDGGTVSLALAALEAHGCHRRERRRLADHRFPRSGLPAAAAGDDSARRRRPSLSRLRARCGPMVVVLQRLQR